MIIFNNVLSASMEVRRRIALCGSFSPMDYTAIGHGLGVRRAPKPCLLTKLIPQPLIGNIVLLQNERSVGRSLPLL